MSDYELQRWFEILLPISQRAVNNDPQLRDAIERIIQNWFAVGKTGTPAERRKIVDLARTFGIAAPPNWAE